MIWYDVLYHRPWIDVRTPPWVEAANDDGDPALRAMYSNIVDTAQATNALFSGTVDELHVHACGELAKSDNASRLGASHLVRSAANIVVLLPDPQDAERFFEEREAHIDPERRKETEQRMLESLTALEASDAQWLGRAAGAIIARAQDETRAYLDLERRESVIPLVLKTIYGERYNAYKRETANQE